MSDPQVHPLDSKPGPLRLPPPPNNEAAKAVRRLGGHSTSESWLPEDTGWPELNELRAEQLRIRDQIVAELWSLETLLASFHEEDRAHDRELGQAHRDGDPMSVEDCRTPKEQRLAERAEVEERLWNGVIVLAEVVEAVIEWVREHEEELLADRRSKLEPALEKEREANRLRAEARIEMWRLAQYGPYIRKLADDGPFGRQPAPAPAEPPAQFDADQARRMLKRPWHQEQPGIGDDGQPVVSWLDQPNDDVEPLPVDDETGVVSELEEQEPVT
jgi:hypothetical protein